MKSEHQFIPHFRRFCVMLPEYVKLKVELGVGVHRATTNRLAFSILKMLRAKATETGSYPKVAITETITKSFALSRRAKS